MSHTFHKRPARAIVVLGALVGALLAGVASPAFAHDELIGAAPAAGSEVEALPSEIVLTFSGVLIDEPGATEVVVTDAAGTDLTGGDPTLDGTRLTQPLEGSASGEVTVIWRVVSSDGHPVSDEYRFTVAGDGAAVAPTGVEPSPTASAPEDPNMTGTDMTPWLWIGALVAVLGGGAVVLIAVQRSTRNGPSRED